MDALLMSGRDRSEFLTRELVRGAVGQETKNNTSSIVRPTTPSQKLGDGNVRKVESRATNPTPAFHGDHADEG
jgi:hypothetical protein